MRGPLGAVAAVLVAAACGGAAAPTKADWIEQAEEVCSEAQRALGALERPRSWEQMGAYAAEARLIWDRELRRLSALPVPTGEEGAVSRLLAVHEQGLGILHDMERTVRRYDLFGMDALIERYYAVGARRSQLAEAYGAAGCTARLP